MVRAKIKIRKIDNVTARQVTFSKRRRGLFKKADELSILCDADVAVIVFSSTGKLFERSSSSMTDILERRRRHGNIIDQLDEPSVQFHQLEDCSHMGLGEEIAAKSQQLRRMRGEDLEGLNMEELQQLEKVLQVGLCRLLKEKAGRMVEENKQLKHQLLRLGMASKDRVAAGGDFSVHGEGPSSESMAVNMHEGDVSDTSLKLGLSVSS